jgi:hypothetical protein
VLEEALKHTLCFRAPPLPLILSKVDLHWVGSGRNMGQKNQYRITVLVSFMFRDLRFTHNANKRKDVGIHKEAANRTYITKDCL